MTQPKLKVPLLRIITTDGAVRLDGDFVLYWMTAFRRSRYNFALERAVDWAVALEKPLLVVEVLACGGRWDSDRHHRFVLEGMRDNAADFARTSAAYRALVEREPGESQQVLGRLASDACLVVTDAYPLPAAGTADHVSNVRLERVDSNGLLPLAAADRAFPTAFAFRRFLHHTLPDHLPDQPAANPLSRVKLPRLRTLPPALGHRAFLAEEQLEDPDQVALRGLPINHAVEPVAMRGGARAAAAVLRRFLKQRLPCYHTRRNEPDEDVASGLSPYLHHGHIATHEAFRALARQEGWSPETLSPKATGRREGWWGMSEPAEAFLDELVTWREVGYNFAYCRSEEIDRFDSLPDWAQSTLDKHARDRREHVYSPAEFEAAATHDPLWNAAQRELLGEGRIHNYLRMLWGKKILQWTSSPHDALEVMIELNNKYAIDGCDPNSYSGIFWVLGRYDRPWGPERPVFGTVRYMSSENTARKVAVKGYLVRFGQ